MACLQPQYSLEELTRVCTVEEFNKSNGLVEYDSGRYKWPVPIVAVTSIISDGPMPAVLTINTRCIDTLSTDPVDRMYPEPRTVAYTKYVQDRPSVRVPTSLLHRPSTSRPERDNKPLVPLHVTEHTNETYTKFMEMGFDKFDPFISVTQFERIIINNLPKDTQVQVTGYNIRQSMEYTFDTFVYM